MFGGGKKETTNPISMGNGTEMVPPPLPPPLPVEESDLADDIELIETRRGRLLSDATDRETKKQEEDNELWEPHCGCIAFCYDKCTRKCGRKRRRSSAPHFVEMDGRKCTDLCFLLLFFIYWLGMIAIFSIAYKQGDPYRLIYGTNAEGVTCGRGNYTGKRLIYYPRLHEDIQDAWKTAALNAWKDQCPGKTSQDDCAKKGTTFYGVCVSKCPEAGDTIPDGVHQWPVPLSTNNILFRCLAYNNVTEDYQARCVDPIQHKYDTPIACGNSMDCTAKVNKKYPDCVKLSLDLQRTTEKLAHSNPVYDFLTSGGAILTRAFGDLVLSTPAVLFCGGLLAMGCSIGYLSLLQHFAKTMVWLTIWIVFAVLLVVTLVLCNFGGLLDRAWKDTYFTDLITSSTGFTPEAADQNSRSQDYYRYTAYLFIGVDICALTIVLFIRHRIGVAVGILREASRAIKAIPILMVFPLIPCFMGIVLMFWWLWAAGYLASCGDMKADPNVGIFNGMNATVLKFEGAEDKARLMVYHFFGLLWTKNLFQAFVTYVIAGCVSEYYFTTDEGRLELYGRPHRQRESTTPGAPGAGRGRGLGYVCSMCCFYCCALFRGLPRLCHHIWFAVRYHLGSLCLGSLIISILELLRYTMEYISHKTQGLQKKSRVIHCAFACVRCLLWCFHKCVTFISRNGYIIIALKGRGFYHSSKEALGLLRRNLARVGLVQIISNFLLRLGSFAVVCACVGFMLKLIRDPPEMTIPFVDIEVTAGSKDLAKVSNPLLPIVATIILSFATSTYCFSVYQMTIDTILVCFCTEHDYIRKRTREGKPIEQRIFMSRELQYYIENMEMIHEKEKELDAIDQDLPSHSTHDAARESYEAEKAAGKRRVYGMSQDDSSKVMNEAELPADHGAGAGAGQLHSYTSRHESRANPEVDI